MSVTDMYKVKLSHRNKQNVSIISKVWNLRLQNKMTVTHTGKMQCSHVLWAFLHYLP